MTEIKVSVYGLTSHSTHSRLFRGRFLQTETKMHCFVLFFVFLTAQKAAGMILHTPKVYQQQFHQTALGNCYDLTLHVVECRFSK